MVPGRDSGCPAGSIAGIDKILGGNDDILRKLWHMFCHHLVQQCHAQLILTNTLLGCSMHWHCHSAESVMAAPSDKIDRTHSAL